jgi:hypothetical protein
MHVAAGLAGGYGQLVDQRQYRIADGFGFAPQFIEIDYDGPRRGADRLGRGLRNHPSPGLRSRQRGLRFQISPNKRLVAKDGAHFSGTEHIAKKG